MHRRRERSRAASRAAPKWGQRQSRRCPGLHFCALGRRPRCAAPRPRRRRAYSDRVGGACAFVKPVWMGTRVPGVRVMSHRAPRRPAQAMWRFWSCCCALAPRQTIQTMRSRPRSNLLKARSILVTSRPTLLTLSRVLLRISATGPQRHPFLPWRSRHARAGQHTAAPCCCGRMPARGGASARRGEVPRRSRQKFSARQKFTGGRGERVALACPQAAGAQSGAGLNQDLGAQQRWHRFRLRAAEVYSRDTGRGKGRGGGSGGSGRCRRRRPPRCFAGRA
jgi:hypothetical protein